MSHSELYGGFEVLSTDRSTDPIPLLENGGFAVLAAVTEAAWTVLDEFDGGELEADIPEEKYERLCMHRKPEVIGLISKAESVALAMAAKTHGGSAVIISVFDDCDEDPVDRLKKLAEALRYVADQVEAGKTRGH